MRHLGPIELLCVLLTVSVMLAHPNRNVNFENTRVQRSNTWVVPTFVHVAFGAPAPNAAPLNVVAGLLLL